MKINKFTEKFDYDSPYKEYDEYSHIDMNQLEEWKDSLLNINKYLDDVKHDIKQYSDFLREYVIFYKDTYLISTNIVKNINSRDHIDILFYDHYKNIRININKVKDIKHITEVAETNPEIILNLYNFYVKKSKALYADVFELPKIKHIIDAEKFNL